MNESILIDNLEKNTIIPVELFEDNPNINTSFVQKQDGTKTMIHEPVFVDSIIQHVMNKSTFDSNHKEYTVASSNHNIKQIHHSESKSILHGTEKPRGKYLRPCAEINLLSQRPVKRVKKR